MRSPFALRRVKDRSSQVRMRRKTLGAGPGIRLWGGCLASRPDLVLYLGLLSLAGASLAPSTLRCTQRLNRSEEHTSELQSPCNLVCRLLLEKKKNRLLT